MAKESIGTVTTGCSTWKGDKKLTDVRAGSKPFISYKRRGSVDLGRISLDGSEEECQGIFGPGGQEYSELLSYIKLDDAEF